MASLFTRERSPFWWIKFRNCKGTVQRKPTAYRLDSKLETRKARELAMLRSVEEFRYAGPGPGEDRHLKNWVPLWLHGTKSGLTLKRYLGAWTPLSIFFDAKGIVLAEQITRADCHEYFATRRIDIGGLGKTHTNTVLFDLKVLRTILFEAMRRDWILYNPASRLGIKAVKPKERAEMTAEDIEIVRSNLPEGSGMRIAFEIALHQGCRLRETSLPLDRFDLEDGTVTFDVKGGGTHVTLIHPELRPLIEKLIKAKRKMTWVYEEQAARDFFRLFKKLKLRKRAISFHSTRVTAVTRMARSGSVSEQQAMRFIGHSSTVVHKVYQRLGAHDLVNCLDALSGSKNLLSGKNDFAAAI
jgi:integrase